MAIGETQSDGGSWSRDIGAHPGSVVEIPRSGSSFCLSHLVHHAYRRRSSLLYYCILFTDYLSTNINTPL